MSPPYTHVILGQKVKGQGHEIKKCKNILKAILKAGVSYALYRVPQPLVVTLHYSQVNVTGDEMVQCMRALCTYDR